MVSPPPTTSIQASTPWSSTMRTTASRLVRLPSSLCMFLYCIRTSLCSSLLRGKNSLSPTPPWREGMESSCCGRNSSEEEGKGRVEGKGKCEEEMGKGMEGEGKRKRRKGRKGKRKREGKWEGKEKRIGRDGKWNGKN